jgi:hypothetical protein
MAFQATGTRESGSEEKGSLDQDMESREKRRRGTKNNNKKAISERSTCASPDPV